MISATPPLPLRIGFTGTCHGLSAPQLRTVADKLQDIADIHRVPIVAHHGCCVGADAEFHALCRERQFRIIGHPGPHWPWGDLCARQLDCDYFYGPRPYMDRNQMIINAVSLDHEDDRSAGIMIAAPYEMEMQPRGGTWSTVRMALKALRRGVLRELVVVGRDGQVLRHEEWRL